MQRKPTPFTGGRMSHDRGMRIAFEELIEFWENVERIPIELLALDAMNIAKTNKLTIYDSFYVAAALMHKVPLLTFDNGIIKKHEELNVDIMQVH